MKGSVTEPVKGSKAGSLKYKKVVRDALDEADMGYADDIYDCSPVNRECRKRIRVQSTR